MAVIDADAHVVETRHTWEHVDRSQQQHKPVIFTNEQSAQETILIDGRIAGLPGFGVGEVVTAQRALERGIPIDRRVSVSEGAFAMENVEARIADMDEFGVDVQVLQPTLFLTVSRAVAKGTTGAERNCTTSEVLRMGSSLQDREISS